jgi:cytochrome P450
MKSPVIIDTHSINTEESVWGKDSLDFRPERFSHGAPETVRILPATFCPTSSNNFQSRYQLFTFGMGHRKCLGKPLAEALIGVLVAFLLKEHEICPSSSEEAKSSLGAWVKTQNPLLCLKPL